MLFSRQLPKGSHNFFQTFSIFLNDYFIRNSQTTIALPFLTHNISAIGSVRRPISTNARSPIKFILLFFTLGVRELFESSAPEAPRKTRAELMKDIDAAYYGFRDDDDGLLVPLEVEAEKAAIG